MKKYYRVTALSLVCFCFIFTGILMAEDEPITEKGKNSIEYLSQQEGENIVVKGVSYQIDGVDEFDYGDWRETSFCNIINYSDYRIGDHTITIGGESPCKIKILKIKTPFSPYRKPGVKLILRIRFEDRKNSYADILYIGDDNNLYSCHGGK